MNYVAEPKKWDQRRISLKCGDTFTDVSGNGIRAFMAVPDGSCIKCCFHTLDAHCPVSLECLNIDCSGTTHFIEIDPSSIVEDML
jgi:hypothetical protein